MDRVYQVSGMSCDHCRRAVDEEVGALQGVEAVKVDLGGGLVTVRGPAVDDAAVKHAIEQAGYEVVGAGTPA